jgi:Ca-activated chloride channel family protein
MRNSRGQKILIVFICAMLYTLSFMPAFGYAATPGQQINAANKFYRQEKFDEALQKYNEANTTLPDSDIINFNIGAALYKKGDYLKAQDAFTKALISANKKLEADALYNIANCKYKSGKLKENTDLSVAVGLMRESLDYYKRAIELDQKNEDARFNHEFVERELKILMDKLKQQQSKQEKQQNQQGQKQEQQQQEQQQNQTKSSAKKEQTDKEQKNEQAEQDQKQNQQKQEKEKSQEKKTAAKETREQNNENKELSPEAVRMLLERYGHDETAPNYMDKQTQSDYDNQVLKDW